MKISFKWVVASIIIIASGLPFSLAYAQQVISSGQAFELNSDRKLYQETYCTTEDAHRQTVIYRDTAGEVIALKELDYSSGATSPSYVQRNYRSGETTSVEKNGDSLELSIAAGSDETAAKSKTIKINLQADLVIDAGFDNYVRQHWDSLRSGHSNRFQFPLATRSRLLELRLRGVDCSYQSARDQCFMLEMTNWFYRMLVNPIELGFDSELRRLKRYRGLANIEDEAGDGLAVDIHYRYEGNDALSCKHGNPAQL